MAKKKKNDNPKINIHGNVNPEDSRLSNFLIFGADNLYSLTQMKEAISSTDISISGTVDAFNNSLDTLERELTIQPTTQINLNIIKGEITELKLKVSELDQQKESLKKVEAFIKDNLEFIMIATEAKGKFNNLETQVVNTEKRIDALEGKANKTKERSIAVWAIIISVVGIIASVLMAVYL